MKVKISQDNHLWQNNVFGDRDLQEKFSILTSYVFLKNFKDFSRTFSLFSFLQDFSRPENYCFYFSVFPGFPRCVGPLRH